ncbi:MAG: hypothetical protein RLZ98_2830 [Pseudomonadota bacterium]|jgi:AcrR family transcriptional regulator
MPKLSPETQLARREHILDAAERCFAAAGFHGTAIQDICREAGVSPGALYGYFSSKEALIAGIAERDRSRLAAQMAELAEAPDLVEALSRLGEYYTVEQPQYKRVLCVEIGAEATRNETVGRIFHSVDGFVHDSFVQLFERAQAEGRIKPDLDVHTLADVLCVIGDGMFWRRAVDPDFDGSRLMPAISSIVAALLNPVSSGPAPAGSRTAGNDR